MPTALAIFEPTYAFIDARLGEILGGRVGDVMDQVQGPLRAALVLYIVLYGLAILRGAIAEPVIDFAIRGIKLAFIIAIATTPAYGDYVTTPLFEVLPQTLARAVSGDDTATVGGAFDELINYAGYLGEKVLQEGSILDIAPWVVGAVVIVVGALAAALGFGVVMIAKIALALLIAIGPIFVACALFEAPRRYFFGWLSQALNHLVLFALVLALTRLVLDLVRSRWSSIESLDPVGGGLIFIALCTLSAFFFLHLPLLAAGVAGGAASGAATFAGLFGGRTAPSSGASDRTPANPSPPASK